jgi:VWFA-related protein
MRRNLSYPLLSLFDPLRGRDCPKSAGRTRPFFGLLLALCLLSHLPGMAQSGGPPPPGSPSGSQPSGSPGTQGQPAAAQAPQGATPAGSPTTLSVNVKVVTVPVTVRDKKGQIVRNLTKDDFELEEDGHPQSIRYFNQETNLPLTLGLLVDTSQSQRKVLDQERTASRSFLDQMVTNKDRAFVVHFDRQVELLQDLTSEHSKLEAALDLLQPSGNVQQTSSTDSQDGSNGGSSQRSRGGGTLLYDSIFLASDELMKKQTGRKAVIVLSDGVDRGSKESLASAIEAAQRADTIVYSIYFADHDEENNNGFGRRGGGGYPGGGYPGGGGYGYPGGRFPGGGYPGGGQRPSQNIHVDGKKILEQISGETGGHFYEISKKDSVDQIYASIAEELRTQYMLGYTPEKSAVEGFHRISLVVKKKDVTIQARSGYYADQ